MHIPELRPKKTSIEVTHWWPGKAPQQGDSKSTGVEALRGAGEDGMAAF